MKIRKAAPALTFNWKDKMILKSKRSQIKIQQMAFMLIAVTLLFAFVGLFILSIKTSGLREKANILEENNAVLLVSKLADSPEFSCEDLFSAKSNCIDADKVMVLKDNKKYDGFWGVNEIKIEIIYPSQNKEILCTTQNFPECNTIEIYTENSENKIYKSNFVNLCRKELVENEIKDKCDIAKLMVGYEENE